MKQLTFTLFILFAFTANILAQTTHTVTVSSNVFTPASLTIDQGDIVVWDFPTGASGVHNVNGTTATYSANPESFGNGAAAAAPWMLSHTFNTAGTYDYQCDPHLSVGMVGTITVNAASSSPDLMITGVFDGPLTGGTPKGVELYVLNNIPDLSIYALGSANNGGGTDGEEYTFDAVSANAGDYIYIATDSMNFQAFFGFNPNGASSAMGINGDDAVELFMNSAVVDIFGDINTDGSGESWDFLDGWAYRVSGSGPDGSTFVPGNWMYSGINVFDGQSDNASSPTPFPVGTYSTTGTTTVSFVTGSSTYSEADGTVMLELSIVNETSMATSVDVSIDAASTATAGTDFTFTDPTTVTFAGGTNANQMVSITITDDAMAEGIENIVLTLSNFTNSAVAGGTATHTLSITDNDTAIPDLVISELFYNVPGDDSLEFIEIHNIGSVAVDLMGINFTNGVVGTVSTSMMVNPGDYAIFTNNMSGYMNALGVAADFEWTSGSLSNGGETVEISDAGGNVVDMVAYDDSGLWPKEADGGGHSLVLCDLSSDNNDPLNWSLSSVDAGVMVAGLALYVSPKAADCTAPVVTFTRFNDNSNEDSGTLEAIVHVINGNAMATTVDMNADASSTATDPDDYTLSQSGTLTFAAGMSRDTARITVTIIDDMDVESAETILLALTNATNGALIGANANYEITINDNDTPPTYSSIAAITADADNDTQPDSLGNMVTIKGIVYGVNLRDGGLIFTVIDPADADAGLGIFSNSDDFGYTVVEGDEVEVTGTLTQFRGLTQIDATNVSMLSAGNSLHTAAAVTTFDEVSESKYVQIDNVTIVDASAWPAAGSSATVQFTDGTSTFDIRIDSDTDVDEMAAPDPTDIYSIAGIGGQFSSSSSAPFAADGYQMNVMSAAALSITGNTPTYEPKFSEAIRFYPNPVSHSLTIESNIDIDAIEITNVLGARVAIFTSVNRNESLPLSNLAAGTYFIKFTSKTAFWTSSIIKD